jgi:phenylalanyl-tRNA synthetase beta chain
MKVPVSWLREYIDLGDLSVQDLADRMTFAGIEIEGIETIGSTVEGVVVGEVVACESVPESNHLSLCRVFDGKDTLDVVCGAPNCALGIKAPFARIGTVLPGGFTISRRKLMKKYESFGMLCAADELGLSSDHSGLLVMDASIPTGTPLEAVLGPAETVFDVEITWNRPDVLSIVGVAREFAALLRRPVKLPSVDFAETDVPVASLASVEIVDREGCPRYTARVLADVKRVPSPDWMRRRLELCGQRSIDIVVDVSNYVMLECGQPLHTFDYDRLAEHRIVVRRAGDGELMRTLDAQPRTLDSSLLVIADAREAVAVAGVMGGAGSEIGPDTTTVLLESATFDAPRIKHGATKLGMRTESSHRFERGVDPGLAEWASRRAASLLTQYAGAKVARGVIDADYRPAGERRVTLRFQRARDVIGVPLTTDEMVAFLASLAIPVVTRNETEAVFAPPSYRIDIVHEADLVEEIARLHGLDALPDVLPAARVVPGVDDPVYRSVVRCRHTLADLGLHEALHYSFLSAPELDAVTPSSAARRVVLPNPVSADYAVLRDSLLPQMIGTLGHNAARQTPVVALFELGRVFFRDAEGRPDEEERLAIGLMGPVGRSDIDRTRPIENEESLLWLKGVLEALCAALHAPAPKLEAEDAEGFQPGWSARIVVDGRREGVIGLVGDTLRHRWRATSPMAVLEVRRDALLGNVFRSPAVKNVPAYPGTLRDIALLADAGITHEKIVATIRKAAPPELVDVALFDIFQGKSIGAGRRSLAYSLEYRSPERTLRDEEANAYHDAVKAALKRDLGVEIREG